MVVFKSNMQWYTVSATTEIFTRLINKQKSEKEWNGKQSAYI